MARILLAEDDPDVRETSTWMLEELGHEVVAVEDGQKALHLLSDQHDFGVVLSDTGMPVMTGVQLLGALREMSALPLVLMSALPDLEGLDLATFARENAAVFIQKGSMGLDEIDRAIRDAIALSNP